MLVLVAWLMAVGREHGRYRLKVVVGAEVLGGGGSETPVRRAIRIGQHYRLAVTAKPGSPPSSSSSSTAGGCNPRSTRWCRSVRGDEFPSPEVAGRLAGCPGEP